jgi:uncharacterized membrane protein YeaQ/YmgE (transglycosylase-associated protein family)
MTARQIVVVLAVGLAAGWLASLVVGGGGLVKYLVWGLLGSVVGGIALPLAGIRISLGSPLLSQIAVATIGAIILVLVARLIA